MRTSLLFAFALTASVFAQTAPARPKIIGLAYIGLRTDNLEASRKFYGGILGFAEPPIHRVQSSQPDFTYFEVNDHQGVELFAELKDPKQDRLSHIAFETTNAEQLRLFLASKGVQVPDKVRPIALNCLGFELIDPDGHSVQFVQRLPDNLDPYAKQGAADQRISKRIIHVGVTVHDRAAADHLYKDILGFQEIWHGGMKDNQTDWVDMRVPDGTDWLEYMLNVHDPDPRQLGVMHHFALGVPSVQAGYETAIARGYQGKEKPQIGRDGKWQYNMYDPNYTRIELMEPKPVQKPCCSPMLQ